jgi:trehalose 6-phosphate synthase
VAARRELIVVSNRAPVTFSRDEEGDRAVSRGGGGLVTGLSSLVSLHDVTWIASAMSVEDAVVANEAPDEPLEVTARDGSPYRLRLIAHDPAAYDWYYNVVSNPILWFAQHYLWGLAEAPNIDHGLHHAWNEGYRAVNRAFADAVLDELERRRRASVFFHDYHLYLAPSFVREARPDATLAHFVHIPWPQPDYWRVLPDSIRRALHEGVLANDVVSFHTRRWRLNFLRCCEDIIGAEVDQDRGEVRVRDRITRVRCAPISVDVREFEELAGSEEVLAAEAEIIAERPEFLVVRVDRTDPSKNVVRGFRAFDLYLDAHPEMHGRVGMLALLDPSRQDIPEYSEYLGAIQRSARAVNDRFQRPGWKPLDLQIQDNFPQSLAAYKQFDVLLVTAIFDGMNLVAKEAPLVNVRDGVMILSENAGAHEELADWAVSINPFDVAGQAEAIHTAITMPQSERAARIAAIRDWVGGHDNSKWIETQLTDLDEAVATARVH